jgi:hypothetical protein
MPHYSTKILDYANYNHWRFLLATSNLFIHLLIVSNFLMHLFYVSLGGLHAITNAIVLKEWDNWSVRMSTSNSSNFAFMNKKKKNWPLIHKFNDNLVNHNHLKLALKVIVQSALKKKP